MAEYQGDLEVQNLLTAAHQGNPGASVADAQLLNRQLATNLNRNLSIETESDEPNYDVKASIGNNFYLSDDLKLAS